MRFAACLAAVAALGLAGCGGGGGGASCSPTLTAAISISDTGVSPVNVCVQPTGAVTFTNAGAAVHTVVFASNCAPATNVPAGQAVAVTFPTAATCSFSIDSSASAAFQGTVAVTTVTVTGGY